MASASNTSGLLQPRPLIRRSVNVRAGGRESGPRQAGSWSDDTFGAVPAAVSASSLLEIWGDDDWTRVISAGGADISRQFQFDGAGIDDILFRGFVDGTGSFVVRASNLNYYSVTSPTLSFRQFAVGDINVDGNADLIWVSGTRERARVITSATGGVPNLSAAPGYSVQPVSSSRALLAVADINGDGRVDLLQRDLVTGEVAMNQSAGSSFGSLAMVSISAGPLSHAWMLGGTGDLNNDGREDLVWRHTDGTVVAWLMNANGTFTSTALASVGHEWRLETIARLTAFDTGSDILWRNMETGQGLVWAMSTSGAFRIAAAVPYGPVESDRTFYQMRYEFPDGAGALVHSVLWHRNDHIVSTRLQPDGSFRTETRLTYDTSLYSGLQPLLLQAFDFQARDFNRLGGFLRSMRTNQYGTVGPAAGNTGRVGLLNAATGAYEVLYLASGTLQLFAPAATGGSSPFTPSQDFIPVGFADVNGDGVSIDLVGWLGNLFVNYVWNGSSYNAFSGFAAGNWLSVAAIGNIDGSTGDEVIFEDSSQGNFIALKYNSAGGMLQFASLTSPSPSLVAHGCADLNGDGRDDLVFRDNVTGAVSYWSFAAGALRHVSTSVINTTPVTTAWDLVGFANIDGDGDDDIIWRRNSDGFTVAWVMQSGGLGSVAGLAVLNWDWRLEGTSDMNGDGTTDLVWRNASGQFAAWMMNNAAIASVATSATLGFDRMSLGFTGAITRAA